MVRGDDCCEYSLLCDKGLYVPNGTLSYGDLRNITTTAGNLTVPEPDYTADSSMITGPVNATMTCQNCPQGNPQYDYACNLGVPEAIRPKAASAST